MTPKSKRKMTAQQFTKRFTDIVIKHLDTLPLAERKTRIAAFERRVTRIGRETPATASRVAQTHEIRLSARDRE